MQKFETQQQTILWFWIAVEERKKINSLKIVATLLEVEEQIKKRHTEVQNIIFLHLSFCISILIIRQNVVCSNDYSQ